MNIVSADVRRENERGESRWNTRLTVKPLHFVNICYLELRRFEIKYHEIICITHKMWGYHSVSLPLP